MNLSPARSANCSDVRLPRGWRFQLLLAACLLLLAQVPGILAAIAADDLQSTLKKADLTVLGEMPADERSRMVERDLEHRLLLAIERENQAWASVKTSADWEAFRDRRMASLKHSLGAFPPVPEDLQIQVTAELKGDGYLLQNLVFQSRPGLYVTANLYLPAEPGQSRPAVLFAHSHHSPKTQGELQDMGMNWARQGWVVLVPDMLGHGERRQHPFVSQDDYPGSFPASRQDYYFRYNVGVQLHLLGESLMGWMAWDLMRCVDLLTARADIDRQRIILIGSVAGGGDPAAVTAALDSRIAAVVPFNFGGPQPDYAIPEDEEHQFNYFGEAYWEMTRCLRLGGRDGFAHWVIASSVAPRRLIYASEFGWRDRDPAWPRMERVFSLYDTRDHLAVAMGRGVLKGEPPENTHCNNVGPYHRQQFYPHLQRWFGMEPPEQGRQTRRETKELLCLTPELAQSMAANPVHRLSNELAEERLTKLREELQQLPRAQRRQKLQTGWTQLLGDITPAAAPRVLSSRQESVNIITIERVALEVEAGIVVPLVLLSPQTTQQAPIPVVLAISQTGKQSLFHARMEEIASLLQAGVAVCLTDLRGQGETSFGESIGFRSSATTLSCQAQVLGQTLPGSQLRDLRTVIRYLAAREELQQRIGLWAVSLAEMNPNDRSEVVPLGIDQPNVQGEPTAGLLVLIAALFEDNVQAVQATGTLASFQSILDSPFVYLPHDVFIPGVLTVGDVSDLLAVLPPRSVWLGHCITGLNKEVTQNDARAILRPALLEYASSSSSGGRLTLESATVPQATAQWFIKQLQAGP